RDPGHDGVRADRGVSCRAVPSANPLQLYVDALSHRQWLVRRRRPIHRHRAKRRYRHSAGRADLPDGRVGDRHRRQPRLPARALSGRQLGDPGSADLAGAVAVLPSLPPGATKLAGEIEPLDMIGVRGYGHSVMVRYQGHQRHRKPLGARGAEGERPDVPLRKAGVEAGRASLLSVFGNAVEAGNGLAAQWRGSVWIVLGDDPGMPHCGRRHPALAFADPKLKSLAIIISRHADRHRAWRQDRDIATVAARIVEAKASSLLGAEIERM